MCAWELSIISVSMNLDTFPEFTRILLSVHYNPIPKRFFIISRLPHYYTKQDEQRFIISVYWLTVFPHLTFPNHWIIFFVCETKEYRNTFYIPWWNAVTSLETLLNCNSVKIMLYSSTPPYFIVLNYYLFIFKYFLIGENITGQGYWVSYNTVFVSWQRIVWGISVHAIMAGFVYLDN